MSNHVIGLSSSVLLFAAPLAAQTDWQQLTPVTSPPMRAWMGMSYDLLRGVSVMAGGFDNATGNALSDTWEFDGTGWTAIPGAPVPARDCMDLAFIASTGRTLVFGGLDINFNRLGDTLEYDGTSWTLTATTGPTPRTYMSIVYDPARDRVVGFGGATAVSLDDTWEYHPITQTWSQITTATTPPQRAEPGLVYDFDRQVVVMFGGWDITTATALSDTWEYDGNDWTQVATAASPTPARTCFGMVYDPLRQRTILHGGSDYNFTVDYDDTWEFDGTTWVQLTPNNAGPGIAGMGMTHHIDTGHSFVYGGENAPSGIDSDETWQFSTVNPAAIQPLGLGCPGSAGTPELSAAQLPWIGETVALPLTNLPMQATGIAVYTFGFTTVSLPLGALSMPACDLHVNPDLLVVELHGGTASTNLPIPNNTALISAPVHTQALSLDSLAAGGFGAMSNALTLVIGSR